MENKLYTYDEYLQKYNLKSRTSIYNKIKKGELEKVTIEGITYIKECTFKSVQGVHTMHNDKTIENKDVGPKSVHNLVHSVHTNQSVHTEQCTQCTHLKHKIELLEMEIKGKNSLISRLETELSNVQVQVHSLLQANVQISTQKQLNTPNKSSFFSRFFGRSKDIEQ